MIKKIILLYLIGMLGTILGYLGGLLTIHLLYK